MDRRRISFRTWMVIIVVAALVLLWVRSQGSLSHALVVAPYSNVVGGLGFVTALVMARGIGPEILGYRRRRAVAGLLALSLAISVYLGWAHYRCMYLYIHGLNHGFPYPDPTINALERWFDARRPATPGNLKLHGEFPTVGFVLGFLDLGFISLSGLLLGVFSNRSKR